MGVVRVSRLGDDAVSPDDQRERIDSLCARDGITLVDVFEELDVSGGAAFEKRPGLRRGVEMVEAGAVDVVIVAYFDRLVRSLQVQAEVVDRVEQAGGRILAVDVGQVANGSAGQWLSGTLLGAVSEYARRVTAERTADARRRAVERGVPPFPNVPPGYRRLKDGTLAPHAKQRKVVAEAFRLRANGATVMEVREHLRRHGIERTFHGTQALLRSRIVLGELRFGEIVNTSSHPAIVDAHVWQKVQRMRSTRGRRAKSDRLLARLGVLRCGSCDARMVIGSTDQNGKRHYMYRCPPIGDCPRRVTISADIAERVVWDEAVRLSKDVHGRATFADRVGDAVREEERLQQAYAKAMRVLADAADEDEARELLKEKREARDRATEERERLEAGAPVMLAVDVDDPRISDAARRDVIRAVIDRAVVTPGRGPSRITVEPFGE